MAFANRVEIYPAPAVQGDRVNNQPMLYTAHNFVNKTAVTCGNFAFRDATNPETQCSNTAASGQPLGIVERTHENVAMTIGENQLTIPAAGVVSIVQRGQMWVTADTTVTVGMKAFAVLADGSVKFAAAGSTVSGAIETTWEAFSAGTTGELIIIDNTANAVSSLSTTGAAATATTAAALDPGAKINGVNFTGAADITITAADPE